MATKIRLKRIGRRNRPFYRLVIMDSRKRRDGAAIEQVGWYNPIAKDDLYSLKEDRILHWLKEGAQPTDTVHDILRTSGLAFKWHLIQQGLSDADIEKEMKKWLLEREDVLARRKQRAEAKAAKKKETSKKKSVEERMKKFNEEVSHWKDYDYVIINDDLERCYGEVLSIIQLEKKGTKKIQKKDEIKDKVKHLIK